MEFPANWQPAGAAWAWFLLHAELQRSLKKAAYGSWATPQTGVHSAAIMLFVADLRVIRVGLSVTIEGFQPRDGVAVGGVAAAARFESISGTVGAGRLCRSRRVGIRGSGNPRGRLPLAPYIGRAAAGVFLIEKPLPGDEVGSGNAAALQPRKSAMNAITVAEQDIARLVPAFYARVRADPVLGPIFDGAIDDWPRHLGKLEAFWSSVMLTSGRYKGQPMIAHLRHGEHMTRANFARWLALWAEVTEDVLGADVAAAFQEKADRIAESLQLGVQFHRERGRVA